MGCQEPCPLNTECRKGWGLSTESTTLLAELDAPIQHVSISEESKRVMGRHYHHLDDQLVKLQVWLPSSHQTPHINHRASLIPSLRRRRLSSSCIDSLAISHIISVHILLPYELSRPPRAQISLILTDGDHSFEYRRHTGLRETLRPCSFLC